MFLTDVVNFLFGIHLAFIEQLLFAENCITAAFLEERMGRGEGCDHFRELFLNFLKNDRFTLPWFTKQVNLNKYITQPQLP